MSEQTEVEAFQELLHALRAALDRFEQESYPEDVGGVRARALVELSRLSAAAGDDTEREDRSAECSGDDRDSEDTAGRGVEMSQLVDALEIDQSNVSRLCKRMHADGQIERVVCCHDRRARRLRLTEDGEELAERASARARERALVLMGKMSDLERLTVSTAVKLLTSAIAQSDAESNG